MNVKLNLDAADVEKLQSALADEVFAKDIASMQTPEEVQAALKEKGVELSIEDIMELAKAINAEVEQRNSEELDEAALDNVAGGIVYVKLETKWFTLTVIW